MPRTEQARRQEETLRLLADARARDALLMIHAYCEQPDCPSREITIWVKDYDRDLLALMRGHHLRCPVCGMTVRGESVHTAAEHAAEEATEARRSVNVQLYERDHGAPACLVAVPLAVFGDDRLPDVRVVDFDVRARALDDLARHYQDDATVIGFRVVGDVAPYTARWDTEARSPMRWRAGEWMLWAGDYFAPVYTSQGEADGTSPLNQGTARSERGR